MPMDIQQDKAYINGTWTTATDGRRFSVNDPYTDERIGKVPDLGRAEANDAVIAAHAAFVPWAKKQALPAK